MCFLSLFWAYSTATRIAASADELSASLLNSCYELAAGSIAACSDAISSGKLNGLDLAKAYVSRGLARQRSKEDDNAISDFNEAIRINPSNTQAFNARGNSYLSLGQYDRAIEDYRQAIELNPKFVPAFFNLGLAYSTTRDFSRALDAYSQAIRIDPKNVGALNIRCYVDIMINDYDAAIRDCSEAVRLDPNHINSYLGLGNAYALLAAKQQKAPTLVSTGDKDKASADYDQAIMEYGQAITLDPRMVTRISAEVMSSKLRVTTLTLWKITIRRSKSTAKARPHSTIDAGCAR